MSKIAFISIALLCAMGLPPNSQAQEYHSGPLEGSYAIYTTGGALSMDPGCLVGLNVVLHILRGPQGEGGITTNEALASFEYLNDVFSAYNITFVHLDEQDPVRVHNLPNNNYWPLPYDARFSVAYWYSVPNAINIYYVDGAVNEEWLGFTGASIPDVNMFIRTGYQSLYPMIHEMGHVFGLKHTHGDTASHDELVTRGPGANCATAGDLLCDTPAEPWNGDHGIDGWVNTTTCAYTGAFKDANDEYYTPDTHNYMSYTNIQDCYTHFSAGQAALMRSFIANYHFLEVHTLAEQAVRFANIVGGQVHASGDIRIYDTGGNNFHTDTSPFEIDLPTCMSFSAQTLSERLLSQTSVYEKHQSWNEDFGTFKLKKTLSIPMSQGVWDEEAWFRPMSPITLNVESDGGPLEPSILFKDPWFMETDGSQPVDFLPFAAPHSPTGARDEQTGGVFEHLNNPDFPKYLYQANRYLDENLDEKELPLSVGDWVCTGMRSVDAKAEVLESATYPDLVDTRFAPTLTRVVQVNQDNAEITAEYKAHRCSANSEKPSAGNSQRRIVYDMLDATLQQADRHYAVYESDGRIYLIMSEDAGNSWSAEALITDPTLICKRPSLAIVDYAEASGILYLVYVDEENNEVVVMKRDSWSTLAWTEIDRIGVTTPGLCHPSVSALHASGIGPAVAVAWEDVGVLIPPSQTPTNVIKLSIYENDAARSSQYYHNGQTQSVVFRDFVFAEGSLNWHGDRLQPQYPEVNMRQLYPRIGISWREEPGRLLYDDITIDPNFTGVLVNNYPAEWIPSSGIKSNTAASLCELTPEYGAPTVAYQAENGWSNWPAPTQSVSWPLTLGSIPVYPVTNIYPLWPISQPVNLNPSRVYVRTRSGRDDAAPFKGQAWGTVAMVFNYQNNDNNITAPSIGSSTEKLRVAVNDGFGGISIGIIDKLLGTVPNIYTSNINDGYDPNVTIRGVLHELYSMPRPGDPLGLQHSLLSSGDGLGKKTTTIEQFMREVTVLQDSSFAVYGICGPQMMLCDSTHIALEWESATFDTIAVVKDAPLYDIVRTAPFAVTAGASFEYATEVFARYAGSFSSQFDFRIEFVDTATEEVVLTDPLNVSVLPSDSAWYVLYRIDISSLEGKTVYMRMNLSDTSSVYTIDVADIYDVPNEFGKTDGDSPTAARPESVTLYQNYPNPFNPSTTIAFNLAEDGPLTLKVYDIFGRLVQTLLSQDMKAGMHSVVFAPATPMSGVYYYQLVSNDTRITRRMVMLK